MTTSNNHIGSNRQHRLSDQVLANNVNEVTNRLWAEYEAFASRDLSEFEVTYLFIDGIAERLHPGQPREAGSLGNSRRWQEGAAASGAGDQGGHRQLQGILPGSAPAWLARSAPGRQRRRARQRSMSLPRTVRQRCLAHKTKNLQSKVPENVWPEFKARASACYQAASPALARLLRDDIVATYGRDLPSAVACLQDDFEACIAHLRFPIAHRRTIRTTNLLERLFGEERRRTKIIPHAFAERAVLKLMYAAQIRVADRWRDIKITEFERRQLKVIHDEIDSDFAARAAPATAATLTTSPTRLSSKDRT